MIKSISFYALLIGINNYKVGDRGDIPPLRGAVDDANDFKTYIKTVFGVPDDQITLLTNNAATRHAIIKALKNLENDKRIKPGDPIFIYYAGHGTEMKAPESWNWECANGTIQAIVPYDCDTIIGSEIVSPIPDRTLNALLSAIAQKKGNNITVVFDCCHSASGTRSARAHLNTSNELEVTPRSAELNRDYPETLDQHIWDVSTCRSLQKHSEYSQPHGIESHILLAACSAEKLAYESRPIGTHTTRRGRFSTALLNLLRNESPSNLRYSDIVKRLGPIPDQVPHCEGIYKDRILFNAKVFPAQRESFDIHYEEPSPEHISGRFIVDAGVLHQISPQSEFALFKKSYINRFQAFSSSHSLGTLSIKELKPFSSTVTLSLTSADDVALSEIIAILTKSGRKDDLQLFIPPGDEFFDVYRQLLQENKEFTCITRVDKRSDANIEIQFENNRPRNALVKLNPPDHPCQRSYTERSSVDPITHPFSRNPSDLAELLSKASRFYRELKLVETPHKFSKYVDVHFCELEHDDFGEFSGGFIPVQPSTNLFKNDSISLLHNPDVPYGIKFTNKTNLNLYINMFYLQSRELAISHWTESCGPTQYNLPDAPLKARGTLAIGWGEAGYPARCCELDENIDFRIDYLKIYMSTEPVNLSYLNQLSPFSSSTARIFKDYIPRPRAVWVNEIIPIIQWRDKTLPRMRN